jgi:hypothetical protein
MAQESIVKKEVESSEPASAESESRAVSCKLARNWHSRAQVRHGSMYDDIAFEPAQPDFCVSLLPSSSAASAWTMSTSVFPACMPSRSRRCAKYI